MKNILLSRIIFSYRRGVTRIALSLLALNLIALRLTDSILFSASRAVFVYANGVVVIACGVLLAYFSEMLGKGVEEETPILSLYFYSTGIVIMVFQ